MLKLNDETRRTLWQHLIAAIEKYTTEVGELSVAPRLNVEEIRGLLAPFDFTQPLDPIEVLRFATDGLLKHQVHPSHPRYFGLFNPAPTTMSIAADALVAAFNPQLAAWSHSPLAIEVEQHLIRAFGERFGYDPAQTDGTFCSGGAEANQTALLTALVFHFPQFGEEGLRGLKAQPVFYISEQSHHSFVKAARFCGLGTNAVRWIATDERGKMNVGALVAQIEQDRTAGCAPFMAVATAGTTSGGIIDDLEKMARLAAEESLWLHVDAAWGGAAAFVAELRAAMAGIERSDSITFDAHKWLSVPMAAGIYLTRHPDILDRACRIAADYMPRDSAGLEVIDPYTHSLQWSRRFIGLKVFLSLAVAGWKGYELLIRRQTELGNLLRQQLTIRGWKVVNDTPLPLVCFTNGKIPEGSSTAYLEAIASEVVSSGRAWLSIAQLNEKTPVLRACLTNYNTQTEDILALISELDEARNRVGRSFVRPMTSARNTDDR
jgi:glutamate/tyrosine decarboxylase-like PLP-dependent enzyme